MSSEAFLKLKHKLIDLEEKPKHYKSVHHKPYEDMAITVSCAWL